MSKHIPFADKKGGPSTVPKKPGSASVPVSLMHTVAMADDTGY